MPRGQLQQGQRLPSDKSLQQLMKSRLACKEEPGSHGLSACLFACVFLFNLPEEDTFSEVMLLPRSLTSLTDALLSCSFNPLRAKANNNIKLEASVSVGNCFSVALYSVKSANLK